MRDGFSRRGALTAGFAVALAPAVGRSVPTPDPPAETVMTAALAAFNQQRFRLRQTGLFGVVDFSLPSFEPRFFIMSADGGRVLRSTLVAHGRGSDPAAVPSPTPTHFSNAPGSEASCLGAFVTGARYLGRHGPSLRIRGLDPTNDNAERRDIVIHSASYVDATRARAEIPVGWSQGCFAVPDPDRDEIVYLMREGAFLYAGTTGAV